MAIDKHQLVIVVVGNFLGLSSFEIILKSFSEREVA
jgi:hypothetical protein